MAGRKQLEKKQICDWDLMDRVVPGLYVSQAAVLPEKQKQIMKKADSGEEVQEKSDKVQIGLTVDSFVIERWIRDRDVFVATARELGAEVNVQDAGADVQRADQPD